MSAARQPLTSIVVVGAGQVGVLAAIAMKRALPSAQVIIVGIPLHPGALADRASTALPFTNELHDRLGIEERAIIDHAEGSHRLLTRLFGWGSPGTSGAVPYGAVATQSMLDHLGHEWGGGALGAGDDPAKASLAGLLADAGRFAVSDGIAPNPIDKVEYALRWSQPKYHALLVAEAQKLGVSHVSGDLTAITFDDDGGIAALNFSDGGRVGADLFLDCSGPAAHLLSGLPDFTLVDWSPHLPLRRLLLARPQQPMTVLEDRFSLIPEGWLAEVGGRDGLHLTLGVGAGVSEQAALSALGAAPLLGFDLEQSCATDSWVGNVIALGDAAARFEPLGHLNLDCAHRQIDLLLEMLPGRRIDAGERTEFNRRNALIMAGVRDTLAMYYAAPAAPAIFRPAEPTHELESALYQFKSRARMPFREEMPLLPGELKVLAAALGFSPSNAQGPDVRSDAGREAAFVKEARAVLNATPPYAEWIRSQDFANV